MDPVWWTSVWGPSAKERGLRTPSPSGILNSLRDKHKDWRRPVLKGSSSLLLRKNTRFPNAGTQAKEKNKKDEHQEPPRRSHDENSMFPLQGGWERPLGRKPRLCMLSQPKVTGDSVLLWSRGSQSVLHRDVGSSCVPSRPQEHQPVGHEHLHSPPHVPHDPLPWCAASSTPYWTFERKNERFYYKQKGIWWNLNFLPTYVTNQMTLRGKYSTSPSPFQAASMHLQAKM